MNAIQYIVPQTESHVDLNGVVEYRAYCILDIFYESRNALIHYK